MLVQKDYEDILRSFNRHKVRYCIVGAFAVAFHGRPRYTKDIDILVEPTLRNGHLIKEALDEFGFAGLGLKAEDFTKTGQVVQLGFEPVRVDIVNSISGCTFKEVWKNKKTGRYGSEKVYFVGLKELVKNKKETGRKIDAADMETLKPKKAK